MNILIVGNGFDLAHGLPTKYSDFLEFIRVIREVIEKGNDKVNWGKLDKWIHILIQSNLSGGLIISPESKQFWLDLVGNNIWVEYFSKNQTFVKKGWIDFESEIASVIKSLDEDLNEPEGKRMSLHSNMGNLSNPFLAEYYGDYTYTAQFSDGVDRNITFKEIHDRLFNDLNKLIRTLEYYLIEYVGKIEIEVISPDIQGINPDKILSFNYTDTYQKLYGKGKIEYDFIHGKADQYHSAEDNRLVLGIDEYLPEERRNTDITFIAFKKYFQRIHKETGSLYKDWVSMIHGEYVDFLYSLRNAISRLTDYMDDVKPFTFKHKDALDILNNKTENHNLYIFGHSLDITDKDVLSSLILNDNVQTTIFYLNREIYGQQIANLVKVIGQDELIRRTGGQTKTITFKQQRPMIEKSSIKNNSNRG
jgi:hypothetical protein